MRIGAAVRHLGGRFSAKVIRKWLERGYVEGACRSPGGHWQIDAKGLDAFAESMGSPKRAPTPRAEGNFSAAEAPRRRVGPVA